MSSTEIESTQKVNELFDKLPITNFKTIIEAVNNEFGEFKLDNETRKAAAASLGVDMATAGGWQTASDIIKHFDLSELAQKNPEAAKATAVAVLSALTAVCPVTGIIGLFVQTVPASVVSKVLGVSLKASPDHLAHILTDYCATKKRETLKEYEKDEVVVEGLRNLAIVCSDELLFGQLKKLVDSKDDEDGTVIGTKDGTVRLFPWDESKWLYKYNNGLITNEKVLVIGKAKGVDKILPLVSMRFNEYGVRYGWLGNCAFIDIDKSAIKNKEVYAQFLTELSGMDVPQVVKENKSVSLNVKTGLKLALATPLIAKDFYDSDASRTRQMLFYGTVKFYYNDLENFLED